MNELPEFIASRIQKESGIMLTECMKPEVLDFVNRRMDELKLTPESYCMKAEHDAEELAGLINSSTVNETYFFRGENQFDFLKDFYFPKKKNSSIKAWCGACSTGEEPLSLLAIAKHCGIKIEITATDINQNSLSYFRKGVYSKNSFRGDGEKYHPLIDAISTKKDGIHTINTKAIDEIRIFALNLNGPILFPFLPNYFDLILIRNTFIYFSKDTAMKILCKISKTMKEDGILILSSNEIASIPDNPWFEKKKGDGIFYFQKKKQVQNHEEKKTAEKISEEKKHLKEENDFKDGETISSSENQPEEKIESYKEIIKFIDAKNFTMAKDAISKIEFSSTDLEYKYFFDGLIHYLSGNFSDAETELYKASRLNEKFWPASTLLAFTYKHEEKFKRSLSCFEHSLEVISEYVKNGKTCYNFTINFDPAYIIAICWKNMDEVRKMTGE